MSLQEPQVFEVHLQSDFSKLIRAIKQRLQQYHKIYDNNNRIIAQRFELEKHIFIHDDISQLRTFLNERLAIEQQAKMFDDQLIGKYSSSTVANQNITLLIKRVASRILEIIHHAYEQLLQPSDNLTALHLKLKASCLRLINENHTLKAAYFIKLFCQYSQNQLNLQIEKLKEIIKMLENGEVAELGNINQKNYQNKVKRESVIIAVESKSLVKREYSDEITKKEKAKIKQRFAILKQAREEANKKRQKQKKNYLKKAKKLFQCLHDVIDIAKEQFLEDNFTLDKQQKAKRIYSQLLIRNKNNLNHIACYREREQDYLDKIINQHPVMFDSSQNLTKTPHSSISLIETPHKKNITLTQLSSKEHLNNKEISAQKKQSFAKKQKILIQKSIAPSQPSPHTAQEQGFCSYKDIGQDTQFVDLGIKPQIQIRQRLPDIFTRASSVDDGKAGKKDKKLLTSIQEQIKAKNSLIKKRQPIKNVEIDSKQRLYQRKEKGQTESKIRLQLRTLGTTFFNEIGKKINKFCDMNRNFV